MTEKQFTEIVAALTTGELEEVASALRGLGSFVLNDERLLPFMENFLDDTRICICSIPTTYGEIRWLAANALAKQYEGLKINKAVELTNTFNPLTYQDIHNLIEQNNLDRFSSSVEIVKTLRDQGKIRTYKQIFRPKLD